MKRRAYVLLVFSAYDAGFAAHVLWVSGPWWSAALGILGSAICGAVSIEFFLLARDK